MSRDVGDLLRIIAALRDPQTGCPWDVEQNFDTIAKSVIADFPEALIFLLEMGKTSELIDQTFL